MRICEFCKTFQISHQAVYAKIKKYAAELEGHISKDKGNVLDLDPFAVNLLKPKKASYKALDERNYYLFKKNKEIVSENERFKAEREDMASKMSDYEAVIEYLKKENKDYADSVALLTQECEPQRLLSLTFANIKEQKKHRKERNAYERKNNRAYRKWYQGNISHSRRCERELQEKQDQPDL